MIFTKKQTADYILGQLKKEKNQSKHVVKELEKQGNIRKASVMEDCTFHVSFRKTQAGIKINTYYCRQHKLCETCNRIRAFKVEEKISSKLFLLNTDGMKCLHLVLKIKNTKQMKRSFDEMLNYKSKLAKTIREKKKSEWYFVETAFGSVECSIDNDGQYHIHLHLVTYSFTDLDINFLRKDWSRIVGEGSAIEMKEIESEDHVKNILNYICKVQPLPATDLIRWNRITSRKHLFFTWGALRKVAVDRPKWKREPTSNVEYDFYTFDVGTDSFKKSQTDHHFDEVFSGLS